MQDQANTNVATVDGVDTAIVGGEVVVVEKVELDDFQSAEARLSKEADLRAEQDELLARILGGFYNTQMHAETARPKDERRANHLLARISDTAYAVSGSSLRAVLGIDAAEEMLKACYGWQFMNVDLPEDESLIQGILPDDLHGGAYAGHSTYGELLKIFGPAKIFDENSKFAPRACMGFKKYDKFFFASPLRPPTTIISVRLKKIEDHEVMVRWFVGKDLVRFPEEIGLLNQRVRCGLRFSHRESRQKLFGGDQQSDGGNQG
jgi:hypothetical protein